jgi:tRNA nucleotidyltransferase/poly(A) polymerase
MSEVYDEPIIKKIPMEIPDSLYQLSDIMHYAGFKVHIAGGAVRDTILGKTPKDYDITTDARPSDVVNRLGPYVKRAEVQGEKSFAVARLVAYDGNEYEFAPHRIDSGTRSGGEAILSTDDNPIGIKEDAKRRDLTINALFYRIPTKQERLDGEVGEVIDYVGGIDDIENEVIRTVGSPEERFAEDRLRILRALRFAGRVGGVVSQDAADAIKSNNSLTEPSDAAVSEERIQEEIKKGIYSSKSSSHYINMLQEFGLFSQILPGLNVSTAISSSKNVAVQLATILRDNDHNEVSQVLLSKRFGNNVKDSVKFLLDLSELNPDSLVNLKKEYKRINKVSKVILEDSDIMDFGVTIGKDFSKFLSFATSPPVVSARDLIAGGMRPGPQMGEALRMAEVDSYFAENAKSFTDEKSDDLDSSEAGFYNSLLKKQASDKVENPLNISIPNMSGAVHIFDMDDTLFWAPEWHTIVETSDDGEAISVDMDFPNMFHKAISFVQKANEDYREVLKKGKKGRDIEGLADSYEGEIGKLRLIRKIVDLPMLGKKSQVIFSLSDVNSNPISIEMLKKYFPSKHLKSFDLRGKYVPGEAVVAGDATFYRSPKTLGTIPNEGILDTYKAHSDNALILTARESMEGMTEGIEGRMQSAGLKVPSRIFTKPANISSGKYKAHIIGQIAQQETVSSIDFYDDNLKYINDVNNILENVYGKDIHSKVSIHRIDVASKPEEALYAKASYNNQINIFKKIIKVANELDLRGLTEEADKLDFILNSNNKDYYISNSDIHGEGTFASRDLHPGDIVGVAIEMLPNIDRRLEAGESLFVDMLEGRDFERTELGRKINHQTNCNARQVKNKDYVVLATNFIPKDTEITLNYADKDMPIFIDKDTEGYVEK